MSTNSSALGRLVRQLYGSVTTDRLVVGLSLFTLYGNRLVDAISVRPVAGFVAGVGALFDGIAVFYWVGVATMYFVHLFSIRAVYGRFDIELLDRYPSFHYAFAAVATVIAQYVFVRSIPSETAPAYLQPALTAPSVSVVLPFIGLLAFAKVRVDEPLRDPDGVYLGILTRFEEDEELTTHQDADDFRRFVPYLAVVVVTALYFTPLSFMGGFTAALRIYPGVLEVLAVVAVVGSKLLRSSRMGKERASLAEQIEEAAAFDSPFYDVISDTPIGAGWGIVLAMFFGTLLIPLPILLQPAVGQPPIGTLSAGLGGLLFDSTVPTAQAVGMLVRAGFWFAFASTPYVLTVFGLWFWYQMARRAPSIIQQRAAESTAFEYDEDVGRPAVARPRGWLAPLAGLLLVTFSHPLYSGMPGLALPALHAPGVQIAAWITSIGLIGWCIVATAAATPRLPTYPTAESLVPITLSLAPVLYAQRNWDTLSMFAVALGVIVFVMNRERLFHWVTAPTRGARIRRTLAVSVCFGFVGWYAQGVIWAAGYFLAVGATFLFAAEWRVRNEAESATEAPTGSEGDPSN